MTDPKCPRHISLCEFFEGKKQKKKEFVVVTGDDFL